MVDPNRIVKLLSLSTSDSDGEALNAIRMANKLLKAERLSWPEFLRMIAPAPSQSKPSGATSSSVEDEIDDMLEACLDSDKPSANTKEFLMSLNAFYTDRGYLTEKQTEALKNIYARVTS